MLDPLRAFEQSLACCTPVILEITEEGPNLRFHASGENIEDLLKPTWGALRLWYGEVDPKECNYDVVKLMLHPMGVVDEHVECVS